MSSVSLLNLRIGMRLGLGFAVVLILAVVAGIFSVRSVTSVAGLTTSLYEHPFTVVKNLQDALVETRTAQRNVRDAVLADSTAEINRLVTSVDANMAAAKQAMLTARAAFLGDKSGFDHALRALAGYDASAHQVLLLARNANGSTKEAVAYIHNEGARAIADLTNAMEPLLAFAVAKAGAFVQGAEVARDQAVRLNLMLVGGAVLLGAVASFIVTRSITRPLLGLRSCMATLAQGEHDIKVPGLQRRDEIGAMAKAVEVFRESASEIARLRAEQEVQKQRAEEERRSSMLRLADAFEASIKGVVAAVAERAGDMRSSAQAMTQTAEQATKQATAVAASVEQASANVQTVASSAEELSSSVLEIGRQVEQSSKIASQAVDEAQSTNTTVEGLSTAAQRIGDVVQLIETIAGQTNLLALNATIEAARAGDAGKGFAVVASEVKSLASQTAKATEDIRAQIGYIQTATGQTVDAIRTTGQTIRRISEIATSIASAVEEQGAATREIATNVQQAAQGTADIATNIATVNSASMETGSAAARVLSVAAELSEQSDVLRRDVDQFLATVRAA